MAAVGWWPLELLFLAGLGEHRGGAAGREIPAGTLIYDAHQVLPSFAGTLIYDAHQARPSFASRLAARALPKMSAQVSKAAMTTTFEAKVVAKVWTGVGRDGFVFPELRKDEAEGGIPGLQGKPNFAVCISGGGMRATTLATGWVRTLFDEQILKDARYLISNSAGSWFNAAFSYLPAEHDRAEFLGAYVPPEELTFERAKASGDAPRSYSHAIVHAGLVSEFMSNFFGERVQKWINWGTYRTTASLVSSFPPHTSSAPPHRPVPWYWLGTDLTPRPTRVDAEWCLLLLPSCPLGKNLFNRMLGRLDDEDDRHFVRFHMWSKSVGQGFLFPFGGDVDGDGKNARVHLQLSYAMAGPETETRAAEASGVTKVLTACRAPEMPYPIIVGAVVVYGNFDIISDHFPRILQLHPTPHALWAVFYLVPRLTSC